jgi:hypothetical protein
VTLRRVLLAAALVLAVLPASAHAATVIGIGDQKTEMFGDARFADLGIQHARLQVGWDALESPWQVAQIDAWLAAARTAGVQPLISFGHSRTNRRLLPSPSRFKYEFRRFRARYPWVTTYATWNEANFCGEPTCHRAALVGAYWRSLRRECPTCTIVAAELLDQPNMVSWVRQFRRSARIEPGTWGLHNYVDANRFHTTGTRRLLSAVRGNVWLTEVGGIVWRRNRPATGRSQVRLQESPSHAAKVTRYLLEDLAPISTRIRRIYLYHWNASSTRDTWDSALVTPAGRARPALGVVQRLVSDGELREP